MSGSSTEKPKKKKLKKRLERWAGLNIVPPLASRWMKWFDKTALANNEKLLTLMDHEELLERVSAQKEPSILAIWHNRLMFGPTAYKYCNGKGAVIMVSRSFDGDVISATLDKFKAFRAVRGSSSKKPGDEKGGREALQQMIDIASEGWDLCITPDGPLGPRYKVKRGVIELAKATGLPIFPVCANCSYYLEAKSWDKTRIPFPYSRFVYRAAPAIHVPADADEAMIEQKRAELEKSLMELTEFVDNFYKPGGGGYQK